MKHTHHAHVQLNTRLLPVTLIALIVLQMIFPYRGWVILFVVLGGAWLISFWWARSLARGLALIREMRFGWAQVGDRLEERFTLINKSWVPAIWIEVLDHSTLPGYQASQVTAIGMDSENRWIVRGDCTQRGAYVLGPTTLRAGDPFGLFTVTITSPATKSMIVLPPVVSLPEIQVAPGGRVGEGRLRRATFERTVNAAGVRDYQPGDSVSWIHWLTSARRDELFVRHFDNTPSGDWWIVLDLNESAQAGQGQNSTIEHGVILAASLADRGLRAGRAVGLVASAEQLVWLAPQGGQAQRWDILRALAVARPGSSALSDVLTHARPALKQLSSLIVITSDLQSDWVKALISFVWRGIVPTVLLFDPRSFGGSGDVRPTMATLADLGIARYIMTREVLDRPEAKPGQEGQFDWRITPRGRAVLVRPHHDATWKVLS